MSNGLIKTKDTNYVEALGDNGKVVNVGLTFSDDTKFEDWQRVGMNIKWMLDQTTSLTFFWGDWLNFGDHKYGEMYSQAVELSGKEPSYLRNAKYVCSKVPPENRNGKLGYAFHQVVAPLDHEEQRKWLEEAAVNGWTVAEFQRAIKGLPIHKPIRVDDSKPKKPSVTFRDFMEDYEASDTFEDVKEEIEGDLEKLWNTARGE